MTDSHTLLSQYARTGSESAFRELVSRYIDLVYSTAFRLVGGDAQSAQDVAQTVFVALAAKAGTLPEGVMLGGWLHQHTRFAAGKFMRTERRCQLRERQAAEMNAIDDHSESNLAQVAPVLDEAIGQLGAEDRTAILLRFFERKDFRGVGDALGSSEDAARKRVDRALEKLHVLLKHRGATLSAAALGTALAAEAVTAAPVGLAGSAAGAALASAAASGGITATLVKLMTMTKLKVGIISVIAVAGVATPLVIHNQSQARLREENQALRQQASQLAGVAAENERLSNLLVQAKSSESPSGELLRLRGQMGVLRRELADSRQRLDQAPGQTNERSNTWAPSIIDITNAEVSQVLLIYADLTGLDLVTDPLVKTVHHAITMQAVPAENKDAAKLIEKALMDQAGIIITRLDDKRAAVTYNPALPITSPKQASKNQPEAEPRITVTPQDVRPESVRTLSENPDDPGHNLVFRYAGKTSNDIKAILESHPRVQVVKDGAVVVPDAGCAGWRDKAHTNYLGLILLFHSYEDLKLAEKTLSGQK